MTVLVTVSQAGEQPSIAPLGRGREFRTLAVARCAGAHRIVWYPVCELPETARVPSYHWLDASSTKGDTWDRGKQIPSMVYGPRATPVASRPARAPRAYSLTSGRPVRYTWPLAFSSLEVEALYHSGSRSSVPRKTECVRFQRRTPTSLQADQNPDRAVVDRRRHAPMMPMASRETPLDGTRLCDITFWKVRDSHYRISVTPDIWNAPFLLTEVSASQVVEHVRARKEPPAWKCKAVAVGTAGISCESEKRIGLTGRLVGSRLTGTPQARPFLLDLVLHALLNGR